MNVPACGAHPFRFAVYRVEWRVNAFGFPYFKRVLATHAWGIYA